MKYYYLNTRNEPVGPVSLDEIKHLIAAGTLPTDPQIAEEGANRWLLLSATESATAATPPPAVPPNAPAATAATAAPLRLSLPISPTAPAETIAKILGRLETHLTADLIAKTHTWSKQIGHIALLVGGLIGTILMVIAAIRQNALSSVVYAFVFILLLAIAQFCSRHVLDAADLVLANTPYKMSSRAILDIIALFAWLGAVIVFGSGVVAAIGLHSLIPWITSLVPTLLLVATGVVALHPQTINVQIGEASAGDEAVALLGVAPKIMLRLTSLFYGLLTVLATLITALLGFSGSRNDYSGSPFGPLDQIVPYQFAGFLGETALVVAALVPVIIYLLYLLSNLGLEVVQSILSLRAKR